MDTAGLSLICAGLGSADEDDEGAVIGYTTSDHCLDNLKDLQRFLRRDDPERREVFKQICKWNIASRDLVPIIENYQADRNLVISAVKVLVFLTMPVEPSSDNVAQQMEYLWDLKAALTRNVAIAVIISLLEDPLDHLERALFTEDDWKMVQLVLTLFRNILAIREITLPQKASGAATHLLRMADSFLELMFQENVMDLILVLTQHVDEPSGYLKQENLLLLEIFHNIFLGRDPELTAKASFKGSEVDGDINASVDSLRSIMEEEEKKKRRVRLRCSDRHSLFSGTFARFSMDGSKTLCKGNPGYISGSSLPKVHKVERGPQKRIAWDNELLSLPKEGITETLRNFLNQFLSGGYNVLMQSIRDDIMKEHHSVQKSDITTFFKVARFVLAFQHEKVSSDKKSDTEGRSSGASPNNGHVDNMSFHGDICGPVAATLNEDMFNLVISRWRETFDSLKETKDYKALSAAGSLMKNMICMVYLVLKVIPEDSRESQIARVLLYKLFYDQTDQGLTQFLLNLFRSFDTHKQPKSDLADLLETIHIMLRLMERLQSRGALRVAKKTRKVGKKKILGDTNETEKPREENVEPTTIDQADETGCPPESFLDSSKLTEEHPVLKPAVVAHCDVTSKGTNVPNTVVDATGVPLEGTAQLGGVLSSADSGETRRDLIDENETSDSSMDDQHPATNEVDFNVSRLIVSFANNSVLQNICWLLKHYKSNSFRTNHYIICMLRRFCEDLEMFPMLYQLSLLSTFYDILAEQKSLSSKEHANIVNFLTKVVRKMLKLMKKQPLLFIDILFWKTRKECHCINADALMSELGNLKKDVRNLGSGEIGSSNDRWRGSKIIADSLGDDEADLVIPHAPYDANNQNDDDPSSGEREDNFQKSSSGASRRTRLRSLSGSESDDGMRNRVSRDSEKMEVPKRRRRSIFNEEQEELIRDLYEKHKDDHKCSHLIAEALDPNGKISSAQVYRKLIQLGLRNGTRRRRQVPDEPLSAGDLATESPNELLEVPNRILGEHESSQKRKKLRRLGGNRDECISNGEPSDEETLQVVKDRTRKKNKSSTYSFAPSVPQHEVLEGTDREDETIGSLLRSRKKNKFSTVDFVDNALQNQESLKGQGSDDETLGSTVRNRKKNKMAIEDFGINVHQQQESPKDGDSEDETITSLLGREKNKLFQQRSDNISGNEMPLESEPFNDIPESKSEGITLQQELDLFKDSGHADGAELLDDFIELELDNPLSGDQGKLNGTEMAEPENDAVTGAFQKAGWKKRHRLVIDDDDDA